MRHHPAPAQPVLLTLFLLIAHAPGSVASRSEFGIASVVQRPGLCSERADDARALLGSDSSTGEDVGPVDIGRAPVQPRVVGVVGRVGHREGVQVNGRLGIDVDAATVAGEALGRIVFHRIVDQGHGGRGTPRVSPPPLSTQNLTVEFVTQVTSSC